jgi:hypothetical protein
MIDLVDEDLRDVFRLLYADDDAWALEDDEVRLSRRLLWSY